MAALSEHAGEPEVVEAAILGARVVNPKIIDGQIVGGSIIGGRVIDPRRIGTTALHALHLDAENRRTEIVAIVGLGLGLLLMYLL